MVKDYLVTNEDEPMEKVVAKLLSKNNETLSTAESCTGGYISHLITSIPGSSAYFMGSIVSYSNDIKEKILDVNNETINSNGAVSETVVIEMAKGALKKLNTTYTIAVSGIMGPDGGSSEKPVGTVWVAVGNQDNIITKQFHFRFDRLKNIQLTAMNAFNLLRVFMLDQSRN
jgi:nicotinamide-nucleotide amidase